MEPVLSYLFAGGLLIAMALVGSALKRLPITSSLIYLAAGFAIGRLGLASMDEVRHNKLLEWVAELAVILSLFTTGLKLRPPLVLSEWKVPLRLAFVSMAVMVAGVTLVGVVALGLPLGAAILLGAILAPTDPVLASDVQLEKPGDPDRLRFGLTGEAGLNDGTAFPFVMLGLGLLGHHDLGAWGLRWLAVDVLWGVAVGLGCGFVLGTLVGRLVLYLRTHHREAVGLDDFLALGLIGLSYGAALAIHAYGFLAVLAAGLALRRIESKYSQGRAPPDVEALAADGRREEMAVHEEKAPAFMAAAVLSFNEQFERLAELLVMVLAGILLASVELPFSSLWFIPLLFLVIRPLAVAVGLVGAVGWREGQLMAWFGIRGVGSLYYLFYASTHGLAPSTTRLFTGIVLAVIIASVLLHGMSAGPLMKRYARRHLPAHG